MTDMYSGNTPAAPGQGTAGGTDVVTQLQGIVRQLGAWVQAFRGRQLFGTFTLSAAATTTIPNTGVLGNSAISWVPTNAAAATLLSGSKNLYRSAISAGTSFTVATADGTSAAGTETFSYTITNPS